MTKAELVVLIVCMALLVTLLYAGARAWKRGADRSANILNVRNCQQAMRGEQGCRQLRVGDPFTREDLEKFFKFPQNIETQDGWILYEAGTQVTGESPSKFTLDSPYPRPLTSSAHLWLKFTAPETEEYVGKYGFDNLYDTAGW